MIANNNSIIQLTNSFSENLNPITNINNLSDGMPLGEFAPTRKFNPFDRYELSEELNYSNNSIRNMISYNASTALYHSSFRLVEPPSGTAVINWASSNLSYISKLPGYLISFFSNVSNIITSALPKVLPVTAKQLSNKNNYETQQEQERHNSDDMLERNERSAPNAEDNIFVSMEYNGGKTKAAGRNDDTYYHLTTKARDANYRDLIDESDSMLLSDLNTTGLVKFINRANEKSRDKSQNLGKCGIFRLFGLFDVKHYSCGDYPMFDNTKNVLETQMRNGAVEIVFNVMGVGTENYNGIHTSLDFPSLQPPEQAFYGDLIIKKISQEAKKYGQQTGEDIVGSAIVLVAKDAKLPQVNKTIDEIELAKKGQSFPILAALCNNPNWLPNSYTTESVAELKYWAEMNYNEKYNYKVAHLEEGRRYYTMSTTYEFPAIFIKDMLGNPFYPQPRGFTNNTKSLSESLNSCYISSGEAGDDILISLKEEDYDDSDKSRRTRNIAMLTIKNKLKSPYPEDAVITSCRAHPSISSISESGPTYIIEYNSLKEVRHNIASVVDKMRLFIRSCALDSSTDNPSQLELENRVHSRGSLRDDISWSFTIDSSSFNDINSTSCYAAPAISEGVATLRQDYSNLDVTNYITYINGKTKQRIPTTLLYSESLSLANCITESNITTHLGNLRDSQYHRYIPYHNRQQFSDILQGKQNQIEHPEGIFIEWRSYHTHYKCFIADNEPLQWKHCLEDLNQKYIERHGDQPVKSLKLHYRVPQGNGAIRLGDLEIDNLNRVLSVDPGSETDLIYTSIVGVVNQYKNINLVTCTMEYTDTMNQVETIQVSGSLCGESTFTEPGAESINVVRLTEQIKKWEAGKATIATHGGEPRRATLYAQGLRITKNPPTTSFKKGSKTLESNSTADFDFEYDTNSQKVAITITLLDTKIPHGTLEKDGQIVYYLLKGDEDKECFSGYHGSNAYMTCPRDGDDEKKVMLQYSELHPREEGCLNVTRAMAQMEEECKKPKTSLTDVSQVENINNNLTRLRS